MNYNKTALITGITGQDGSYLAELLLEKGYEVHGIMRRTSVPNLSRIEKLLKSGNNLELHHGDLSDGSSITRIIEQIKPLEIYNLGAQSDVGISFDQPEYTAEIDALGPLRILEAIRILGLSKRTKIYQASTSELFGKVKETPQSESTPFYPRSPYGVAKLYAYWITINYREAYGIYACNGILFNHESPRRGENFVTKKITKGLTRINEGLQDCLKMGNIDSLRDWGHAKDFVEMQWRMLQQKEPEDYVIATGRQTSVKNFIELCAKELKWGGIIWEGKGLNEIGKRIDNNKIVIRIDPKFYRPSEVESLLGNPEKALKKLEWKPKTNLEGLVNEMIKKDLEYAKVESLSQNLIQQ